MLPIREPHRITSAFGTRTDPITHEPHQFHPGIDLVSDSDDWSILAVADGEVVDDKDDYSDARRWAIGGRDTVGNRIVQRSIIDGKTFYITYYHMAKNSVSLGQKIAKGERIGEYGDVGYSAGPHVHLQCWDEIGYTKTGVPVDPSFLLIV